MRANWSIILNVLLIGVVVVIGRLMQIKRRNLIATSHQPVAKQAETKFFDDIIAVRKVNYSLHKEANSSEIVVKATPSEKLEIEDERVEKDNTSTPVKAGKLLMMFLLAKENRQLAGYELLQTVLAAGLRYGEGHLFHRHQHTNGQGPILCSLAAATTSGMFDLQNIGAFSVRGLCLFMETSGNPVVDMERFTVMHETAKQLSDGLDAYLLDEQRQLLSAASVAHYQELLTTN
jgi:cell division protein ZipA